LIQSDDDDDDDDDDGYVHNRVVMSLRDYRLGTYCTQPHTALYQG